MRGLFLGCLLWSVIGLPIAAEAVTPALTDRETVDLLRGLGGAEETALVCRHKKPGRQTASES